MLVRPEFKLLFDLLHYQFKDLKLLNSALTHRSFDAQNNERMEFLGDSILSFVIAEELYSRFPTASEGELSRLRSYLVKGETLSEIAADLNLGDYLLLGQGELKSGGYRRPSILADGFEALLAAIYQDSDLDTCKAVILKLYSNRLNSPDLKDNLKDSKTQLQEYLQAMKVALPKYILQSQSGEQHCQEFVIECRVEAIEQSTTGQGGSRRRAEQMAARKMLKNLRKNLK